MDRLPTHFWIDALIRRAQLAGAGVYVLQKGDAERGDVLVKVVRPDKTACALTRSPLSFEEPRFDRLPGPGAWDDEAVTDDLVARRRAYDPDLWIVEIEDREGRHFLTEKVNGE